MLLWNRELSFAIDLVLRSCFFSWVCYLKRRIWASVQKRIIRLVIGRSKLDRSGAQKIRKHDVRCGSESWPAECSCGRRPNHKAGDRPFKARAQIPLHDFRRGFYHLMPAFLSSIEWRIANFMIPVAFIDYIQGYTSGELCKHSEVK